MPVNYAFTPFISFVFVNEPYRGKKLSKKLVSAALEYAKELGYKKVYLMSGEIGLYEKYGFQKLGDYKTIYDTVGELFVHPLGDF